MSILRMTPKAVGSGADSECKVEAGVNVDDTISLVIDAEC